MKEVSLTQEKINLYCGKDNLKLHAKKKTSWTWLVSFFILLGVIIYFWVSMADETSDDPLGGVIGGLVGIVLIGVVIAVGIVIIIIVNLLIRYGVRKSMEKNCKKSPMKYQTLEHKKGLKFRPFSRRKIQYY